MGLHKIDGIAGYVRYLQESPLETLLLFKELLIGVTSFFRDPAAWEHLQKESDPGAADGRAPRAECSGPGCLRARPGRKPTPWPSPSMRRWRKRSRPRASRSRSSPPTWTRTPSTGHAREPIRRVSRATSRRERLHRFFVQTDQGYRVRQEIRETVIFATQNIIMDPPFTKLDILSCRNLLIYLSPELQKKLLPLFHYSLNPGGILCLGSAETLGAAARSLCPDRRQGEALPSARASPQSEPVEFPSVVPRPRRRRSRIGLQARAPAPNLQVDGGPVSVAALLAGRRADQRPGRHPLRQWAHREIPGTGSRQGQLEHPCHGARTVATRAGQRFPEGAANGKRTPSGFTVELTTPIKPHRRCKSPVEPLHEPKELHGMVMVMFTDVVLAPAAKAPAAASRRNADATSHDGAGIAASARGAA